MWYEWQNEQDFKLWHDFLCEQLGYPLTPANALTGLPDETAQKTTSYTTPISVSNKVIAWVEDDEATGLTLTELRPPIFDFSKI